MKTAANRFAAVLTLQVVCVGLPLAFGFGSWLVIDPLAAEEAWKRFFLGAAIVLFTFIATGMVWSVAANLSGSIRVLEGTQPWVVVGVALIRLAPFVVGAFLFFAIGWRYFGPALAKFFYALLNPFMTTQSASAQEGIALLTSLILFVVLSATPIYAGSWIVQNYCAERALDQS